MSATRLLVLGVVRMRGEAHGYQVRQDLLMWAADRWANVKQGSIYHALKKLTAEELLEEVHTEESGLGPDRVVYRITPQGEGDFFYLMSKGLGEGDSGPAMFNAALPFITALERKTVLFLLKSRIRQAEGQMATTQHLMDTTIAEKPGDIGKPAHIREMFRYWNASVEGVVEWLRDLVKRLEDGEYEFADENPAAFGAPPVR
ncbi:PadR family transcriptional regulator [Actinocrispum sp. NPDC049592]|uniref:PadR family transcriptional regulator n=1 Tax=Actinocrispum sp. NPDC049592 TaxID=3154835 RepID=UPI0034471DB8